MPPKTRIADRTLYDLQQAIRRTVDDADTPEDVDAAWQQLHGPARDALAITHWRMLIEQEKQKPTK